MALSQPLRTLETVPSPKTNVPSKSSELKVTMGVILLIEILQLQMLQAEDHQNQGNGGLTPHLTSSVQRP